MPALLYKRIYNDQSAKCQSDATDLHQTMATRLMDWICYCQVLRLLAKSNLVEQVNEFHFLSPFNGFIQNALNILVSLEKLVKIEGGYILRGYL